MSLLVGIFAQIAVANSVDMQLVFNSQGGNFFAGSLPTGFTSKEVSGSDGTAIVPSISADLKKTLNQLEEKEKLNWIDYVTSAPWEFVDCQISDLETESEEAIKCYKEFQAILDPIALDPEQYFGSPIIELEATHAIYKNEQLVGYVFEFSNHVDGSIIQDGSGIVIYLDADMNVLYVDDWQA